ncbi:MAG TPA: 4-hydroxybenzoate 3-monooxygenase [Usitatibacter sp.]|nr:4-hydroxybenzoate 3-monooxygenase [Usitatibacter sp.]
MRTQVGIVGGGAAGLLLSHLLASQGIHSVVLERSSRAHVEERIRAGVLEQGTVELLTAAGVGKRLAREGLVHRGIELRFGGGSHRVALTDLTGRSITVYGQQEIVKDLIAARVAGGGEICFQSEDVRFDGLDSDRPSIHYVHEGASRELQCDFIAGCDGFHGASRAAVASSLTESSRAYPFAWLGILVAARPAWPELVYASHERGFALYSMRSPTLTRLYLQCRPEEDLATWSDARLWDELNARLEISGEEQLVEGEILQRAVTPMRSFVAEPMRVGRMFLAGDAAHIVPPTGAKGLNLAVNDVRVLSQVLAAWYAGNARALDEYSPRCLARVWRAEHFSWWMTSMLHRFDDADAFQRRLQRAQLEYVCGSRHAAASLAENYVGLPFD